VEWPSLEVMLDVLLLQNYNTRLVVLSTTLLGLSCGLIGAFLLLRKRSLMSDALAHATLPGIALAFLFMVLAGGSGKALPGLLLGASLTGALGCALVLLIRNVTRVKDDAAMGIILSVFFGLGVALLGMVQTLPTGSAAGLEYFIYGKAASMVAGDFWLLTLIAGVVVLCSILFFKEFRLLCFDESYTASLGWPVHGLDLLMLALVTLATVAGLQAVGLILIIAFLIIPAAAARFWTEDLSLMLVFSGALGAASGWLGSSVSALLPRLPAGAIIVLVATALFLVSLLLGRARGIVHRFVRQYRLRRKVGRQHLLRAIYEILESRAGEAGVQPGPVAIKKILRKRSWTEPELQKIIHDAENQDYVASVGQGQIALNEMGFRRAAQITRNHRLWEMYLIEHADIAPSHVDRDADAVEHILGEDMVRDLEMALENRDDDRRPAPVIPPRSPHTINGH
jgi:manganese/zinc/iron transport system permease protein